MCLVLFSYENTPGYRLILAANRDEFYARKTAPLQRWGAAGTILSGRDLQAGGTWLAVSAAGRFGVVTNFREVPAGQTDKRSRGEILVNYLNSGMSAAAFVEQLHREGARYQGFNLVAGDQNALHYCSNRGGAPQRLDAGVYALSNHLLDTPWPKVERGRRLFDKLLEKESIATDEFLNMLADRTQPADDELPDTGVGPEWERILGPIFIRSQGYGTRSSAVVTIDDGGVCCFLERTHDIEEAGAVSDISCCLSIGGGDGIEIATNDQGNS